MNKRSPFLPLFGLAALLAAGCSTPATSSSSSSAPSSYTSAASASSAITHITVTFQNPDKFTDARSAFGSGTDHGYLDILSNEVKQTAALFVPPDQKLVVTVTDVDLAGDFQPNRVTLTDVRIIKEIYRPRITLTFKLTGADGKVLKEGDRTLTDSFFMNNINTIQRDEPLFYDREMIEDWVRDEFKTKK